MSDKMVDYMKEHSAEDIGNMLGLALGRTDDDDLELWLAEFFFTFQEAYEDGKMGDFLTDAEKAEFGQRLEGLNWTELEPERAVAE